MRFLGWRDVPVNDSAIGTLAAQVMPRIRQFFVQRPRDMHDEHKFELKLFVLRKVIYNAIQATDINDKDDFYVCSLSLAHHRLQGPADFNPG